MNNNLILRCISGAIIGIVFLIAIFIFRDLFNIICCLIAACMLLEWYNMTNKSYLCMSLGLILIPAPIVALLIISYIDKSGRLLATYFCIIWTVDIMAMFGGKLVGGKKLAPRISPNKTISGLVIGVLSAAITFQLLSMLPNYSLSIIGNNSNNLLIIYTIILGTMAQVSDLSISIFKRKFDIKDSGAIIPGHGGMLDRFDSIIITAPMVLFFLLMHMPN